MAAVIYSLCALTSLVCAVLLLRSYARSRIKLLFWSGLCFAGLTVNNVVLVLDRFVYTDVDLSTMRLWIAVASIALLVFGLVWEES